MSNPHSPLFDGLDDRERLLALHHLRHISLEYGEVAVMPGQELDALLSVERGSLSVFAGGYELHEVRPNQLVGARQLFDDPVWTHTIKATAPTELLVVDYESYLWLWGHAPGVAFNIERHALRMLASRMAVVVAQICSVSAGEPDPPRPSEPTVFETVRWVLRGRPARPKVEADPYACFDQSDLFADAAPAVLARLGQVLQPVRFDAGEVIYEPGDRPENILLIASGTVEERAPTGVERSESLVVLEPGQLLGAAAVLTGHPRATLCRAAEEVVAFTMPRAVFLELVEANDTAGSAFRRAALRALGRQVDAAQQTLCELHGEYLGFVREAVSGLYARQVG